MIHVIAFSGGVDSTGLVLCEGLLPWFNAALLFALFVA